MPENSLVNIQVRPSEVIDCLEYLWKAGKMPFIHGGPGVAKSSLVAQAAAMRGLPLYDVRAAQLDPVDLRGLPQVIAGVTVWAKPDFLPTEAAVVFFDEVNRAPILVQNACFQLFLDRRLGNYVLPDDVLIVAAGNREQDGGGVIRMPSALSNRLVHLHLEPNLDDWVDWARKVDVDPGVVAFLKAFPHKLYAFDRDQHAFPTPRAWSFVSDIIKQDPPDSIMRALIAGSIGTGHTVEFLGYLSHFRTAMFAVDDILADPEHAPVPQENDEGGMARMFAVAAAVSYRSTQENFKRALTYLNRLPTEFNVYAVKDAINRDDELTKLPEFLQWAKDHHDALG